MPTKRPVRAPKRLPYPNEVRHQSAVTPNVLEVAKRFPGKGPDSIKKIIGFVEKIPIDFNLPLHSGYERSAEKILAENRIGMGVCMEKSHLFMSILTAKGIPSRLALEMSPRRHIHAVVEFKIRGAWHSVQFGIIKTHFEKGNAEKMREKLENYDERPYKTVARMTGADLGQLGISSVEDYRKLVKNTDDPILRKFFLDNFGVRKGKK